MTGENGDKKVLVKATFGDMKGLVTTTSGDIKGLVTRTFCDNDFCRVELKVAANLGGLLNVICYSTAELDGDNDIGSQQR